jgi:hypothetical protein
LEPCGVKVIFNFLAILAAKFVDVTRQHCKGENSEGVGLRQFQARLTDLADREIPENVW